MALPIDGTIAGSRTLFVTLGPLADTAAAKSSTHRALSSADLFMAEGAARRLRPASIGMQF